MHFILISKKDNYSPEKINEHLLNSPNAPSLISREAIKLELNNFILYVYPYNHVYQELFGHSYHADSKNLFLINGMVNVDQKTRKNDIKEFFDELKDSSDLFGDYQLLSIDADGNGFLKTPNLSVRQLFFYEDEACAALSTEIKLITDGIEKFKESNFVNHYDIDFIEDSIFREWSTRKVPEKTLFKEIERIFPQDMKYFKNGKIIVDRRGAIQIPQWFQAEYEKDKRSLYDLYYENLVSFAETNLLALKPFIDKIVLALTGGFDSRLTVCILSKICKKHQIPLECYTSGQETHPDVVIAKKIAEFLDIKFYNSIPENNYGPNTKDYNDYLLTFYLSQGDFNSKDYTSFNSRRIRDLSSFEQLGMDAYKRFSIDKIYSGNRWFARRILFHKNFFFPLFFTEQEIWFARLFSLKKYNTSYKEFVYEILKRAEPKLLEIPFAGDSLPQLNVEPYLTTLDSKHHEKEPFLWDYNLARERLKPLFEVEFQKELGKKSKFIFKILGLNEFDYFFNQELRKIINSYRENKISIIQTIKMLIKERQSPKYPRTKKNIKMTKDALVDPYFSKMQIIMDFAVGASINSFEEIESEIGLPKE